jgi:hypothetical protein
MYQGYVSSMYQYHQDMNLNQGPPRHALSMCHTIHDTSLKQEHKIHTFTHEEDLVHIISDQQTNLVHIIFRQTRDTIFFKPFSIDL